ncbi:molybdate ABC transporter substrate-binding protein [Paracoccus rhizosphaerae]|uniref:Molybdate ABC transporter substrate-binding protein n=1 Tax=Paracoccus rhizosphaerae TaxID=1133347 RepID=A0ABV6CIU6_9RHOB|nr:molybdate ABC transporter substrate-binding protein [Paracoccus rhizosphaerae]
MKFVATCTVLTLAAAAPSLADEVTVFAAAAMKTALDRIAADFEAETGHDVTLVLAGSNLLARQIIQGAPADIFLSASAEWMDVVEAEGMIVPGTRADLLGNALVLVSGNPDSQPVRIGPRLDLPQLLDGGRLAMALVDSVPAGQYGKAALTSLGLWDGVADHVAQADNVRAALALVSTGEAPLGVVYATDAAADPGVSVMGTFPADSHPAITYPVALLTGSDDPADRAFLDALSAPAAQQVFRDQGFTLAP